MLCYDFMVYVLHVLLNNFSLHILDLFKDIGIYKHIKLSQTLLIINKSIWH